MTFILGSLSRRNLQGVHPGLVLVVEQAITLTAQDFRVHDGLRSAAEQRRNLSRGVSATLDSKHLRQADGHAHAVDLVPVRSGRLSWDWPGCIRIAHAMARAAAALEIPLRWGGVWDRPMAVYAGSEAEIRAESRAYVERRRARGHAALLDGPHYELVDARALNSLPGTALFPPLSAAARARAGGPC